MENRIGPDSAPDLDEMPLVQQAVDWLERLGVKTQEQMRGVLPLWDPFEHLSPADMTAIASHFPVSWSER